MLCKITLYNKTQPVHQKSQQIDKAALEKALVSMKCQPLDDEHYSDPPMVSILVQISPFPSAGARMYHMQ